MATRMQQRRGTAQQWTDANPILAPGEIGFETDTGKFKIGDGVNTWTVLSYFLALDDLGGSLDDYILLTEKGAANGVATLDGTGQIPLSQLSAATSDATTKSSAAETNANSYTDTAIANLIDSAPGVLDTLNELAAAINDDANFAATVASSISTSAQSTLNSANAYTDGEIDSFDTVIHADIETAKAAAIAIAEGYTDDQIAVVNNNVTDQITVVNASIATETLNRDNAIAALDLELTNAIGASADALTLDIQAVETQANTIAGDLQDLNIYVDAEILDLQTAVNADIQAVNASIAQEVIDRNTAIDSAILIALDDAEATATTLANNAETDANTYTDTAISTHNTLTTNIHGIADTAELETQTGAQAKADNALTAAQGYTDTHASDTTNVHGIADTAELATKAYADGAVSTHNAVTLNVHGIADTSKLMLTDGANTQTVSGDVTITGSLTVSGTTTTVNATDLVVADPLIYIGEGNSANLVDLGLVSSFNDGTYQHSGIVRDSSAGKWKIFKGVTDEPTTTINFAQGSLDDLAVNNIEVAGVVFSDGTQTKQGVPSITPINQKTASYTTVLTDRDSLIEINSQSATTLTIPDDASVAYPVGTSFDVLQTGSGQITIAGASGVTVNATPGLKLRTQWSSATILKRAADTWVVYGDLTA